MLHGYGFSACFIHCFTLHVWDCPIIWNVQNIQDCSFISRLSMRRTWFDVSDGDLSRAYRGMVRQDLRQKVENLQELSENYFQIEKQVLISRGKPVIIGAMKGKTVMNFEDIIEAIKPLDQWDEVHSNPIGEWSGYETLTKKKHNLRIVKDSDDRS